MTYLHFNEVLLGIKDPNITLTGALQKESYRTVKQFRPSSKANLSEKQANQAVLSLEGHLDKLPKACVHCGVKNNGSQDIIRNGSMKTAILIGQYNYQAVYLKLKKQRYLCKHCRKTTIAESTLINRHCFISNPVKFLIVKELSEIQSMTLIAKHMNVSTHTVIRQLKAWGDNLNPRPNVLPFHLSIDEFKSVKAVKNAMSAIIMDNAAHKVIDILEDRTQEYLRAYFLRFPLKERLKVKTITMDMYSPYREFLPRLFPNAIVIIDRFHIVQLLNRALNKYRIDIMNSLRYKQPRDYNKLKKLWKLILKPREALDYEEYKTHRLFDGLMTEKGIVSYLTNLHPRLRKVYNYVHRTIEAIREHRFTDFKKTVKETRKHTLPKKVRTAFNTLTSYEDEIENSLTYTLSNGVIEGTINKIKMIKRSGYGYRNYGHLRCRILISTQLQQTNAEPKRHLYFTEEDADRKYNKQSA